eukprot:c11770_g1_i1.p1 GENE.c11770_g1_i1~~c11770_g1_i1.p1  ORF type:complete len:413 (+),score=96.36 c11770_g1_i1:1-1239(+)
MGTGMTSALSVCFALFVVGFLAHSTHSIPQLPGDRQEALSKTLAIDPKEKFQDYLGSLGLTVEEHFATTDDGYILRLYRIPGQNSSSPVVILQHGILASMWSWVDNNVPDLAPGIFLARQGFEIWFTNSRGNTYSRNHTTLSPTSDQFWDFTFAEMGRLDVPANIQYVLQATGKQNISFVGWSQGTTQMFIASLEKELGEWLRSRVNVFVALSPVTYLNHCQSELIDAMATFHIGEAIYAVWKKGFLDGSQSLSELEEFFCKITFGALCTISVDTICGHSKMDDTTSIENFAAHFPDGTSTKDMVQYEQFVEHKVFQDYDYGSRENQAHYNQTTPPQYNLTTTRIPIALFCGTHDDLVAMDDRASLLAVLPPSSIVENFLYQDFSHITWMVGDKDAGYWLNDLNTVLRKYAS